MDWFRIGGLLVHSDEPSGSIDYQGSMCCVELRFHVFKYQELYRTLLIFSAVGVTFVERKTVTENRFAVICRSQLLSPLSPADHVRTTSKDERGKWKYIYRKRTKAG
jgi:hypothetical protein